jgi:uncharacterized protein YecT (DUF1311 family)
MLRAVRRKVAIMRMACAALTLCCTSTLLRQRLWRKDGPAAAAPQRGQIPARRRRTRFELTQCTERELTKSEATLTQTYKRLLADLDDEHRPLLEKAQRAWAVFRDVDCDLDASQALGGSLCPMLAADCRSGMTDARVKALQELRKTLSDFLR